MWFDHWPAHEAETKIPEKFLKIPGLKIRVNPIPKNPRIWQNPVPKIPGLKIRVNHVPKNPGIPGFGKIPSRKIPGLKFLIPLGPGHEAGGGDEEGEEGPVDGVPVGAGLGQKRQLSYWCLRWSLEMKPWYKFMLSNLCFASLLQMCIHSVRPSFSIMSTILSTIWIYWWIVVVFCWVNCSIMRSRTWNKCLKKKNCWGATQECVMRCVYLVYMWVLPVCTEMSIWCKIVSDISCVLADNRSRFPRIWRRPGPPCQRHGGLSGSLVVWNSN